MQQKLFTDKELLPKKRPTGISKSQEEQMYIDLAKEIIKHNYINDDDDYTIEDIIEDLKQVSFSDSGFEIAKTLESYGNASYVFDGDFIDWLDHIGFKKLNIATENVKTWVNAYNPQPKFEIGTKLTVKEVLNSKLKKDEIIYITGIKNEVAQYTVSTDREKKGGYLINYEDIEKKCDECN